MPRLGCFAAWMRCNEQILEEYDVTIDGNVVTAWVASEAGQKFDIIWDVEDTSDSAKAVLLMDGNFVRQRIHNHRRGPRQHTFDGVQVDETCFRPFVFEAVSFTEGDALDLMNDPPDHTLVDMGTVTVQVNLIRLVQRESRGFHFKRAPSSLTKNVVLPEGSKRLGALRIGLSGGVTERRLSHRPSSTRLCSGGDIGNGPAVIFNFKYRPQEILKAEGVIPTEAQNIDPSQPNDSRDSSQRLFLRDIDSNTPQPPRTPDKGDIKRKIEIQRLRDQQADVRKKEADLQRELDQLMGPDVKFEIKTESGMTRETALVIEDDDGVIDLTAD